MNNIIEKNNLIKRINENEDLKNFVKSNCDGVWTKLGYDKLIDLTVKFGKKLTNFRIKNKQLTTMLRNSVNALSEAKDQSNELMCEYAKSRQAVRYYHKCFNDEDGVSLMYIAKELCVNPIELRKFLEAQGFVVEAPWSGKRKRYACVDPENGKWYHGGKHYKFTYKGYERIKVLFTINN